MPQPHQLTVTEAAEEIRSGRLTPVALMESLLARAEALESQLNIWVTLDPDSALEAARESQRVLERSGPTGPMHGVPVGVKDIYYTRGVRTTACSPIYADFVPEYDATTVALLKGAGAIIMGKTVTTEFACGDPSPTRNPWNFEHTPGGSSSGSAAGVAARVFPAALGSQTGGSVLRPASYNGVVGLKPTFSRISRYGVMAVAWSLDTMGFFTRTVEDAALMLAVLAGHDPADFSSTHRAVPDYRAAIGAQQSPPRIGVIRQFFYERSDGEVRTRTDEAIETLTGAGAEALDVELPSDFDTVLAAHGTLMNVEAAAVHEKDFSERPDDYAPIVRNVIEEGMLIPAVTYVQSQRIRRRFRRDLVEALKGFDILLTPTTATPAPRDLTTTGNPMFQSPWTFSGLATITVPSGLSESGLPLGIQLASGPFEEEKLLAAAHWCERTLGVQLESPV